MTSLAVAGLWKEMVCCITKFPCSRFLFRANEKHLTTMMCIRRAPPEVIVHKELLAKYDSVSLGVEPVATYIYDI